MRPRIYFIIHLLARRPPPPPSPRLRRLSTNISWRFKRYSTGGTSSRPDVGTARCVLFLRINVRSGIQALDLVVLAPIYQLVF